MSIRATALAIALLTFAAPAGAQTWWNGHPSHPTPAWRPNTAHPQPPHRTNGRNDCGNGDCRGANSPGNMGGAPGDF